jgi:hydrogenase maturation protease
MSGTERRARVVGLGHASGGDDGVGLAVLARLRAMSVPAHVELVEATEPSTLVSLLDGADPVVLVDAVVGTDDPGRILRLEPEMLQTPALRLLSTHGVEVPQAIELARVLSPATVCKRIRIVGITIRRPGGPATTLSPDVAAAVPAAAAEALRAATG